MYGRYVIDSVRGLHEVKVYKREGQVGHLSRIRGREQGLMFRTMPMEKLH